MKTLLRLLLIGAVLLASVLLGGMDKAMRLSEKLVLRTVASLTGDGVFTDADSVPAADWALVPGTAVNGEKLRQRCRTAAALFRAGKVKKLLLSGDGRRAQYDEPAAMRHQLLALGVPGSALVEDARGLSTYDSIRKSFDTAAAAKWIIVTQRAYAPRALLLAGSADLSAVAIAADPKGMPEAPTRREALATVRALLDVLGARSLTEKWEASREVRVLGLKLVAL
jgi:SanA protein